VEVFEIAVNTKKTRADAVTWRSFKSDFGNDYGNADSRQLSAAVELKLKSYSTAGSEGHSRCIERGMHDWEIPVYSVQLPGR
jgi:hypothetical protein